MKTQHWLVKSEPQSYSWENFLRDGHTAWTGVRNYQARINLNAMRTGDTVLFYESVTTKAIVGIGKVSKPAFPDTTADEPGWVAVELTAESSLAKPVTLAQVKAEPALAEMKLLRQSRMSVVPVTAAEFKKIISLSR